MMFIKFMNTFVIFIQRLKINDATISDLLFSVQNGKNKNTNWKTNYWHSNDIFVNGGTDIPKYSSLEDWVCWRRWNKLSNKVLHRKLGKEDSVPVQVFDKIETRYYDKILSHFENGTESSEKKIVFL